jgi:hypothetical protein
LKRSFNDAGTVDKASVHSLFKHLALEFYKCAWIVYNLSEVKEIETGLKEVVGLVLEVRSDHLARFLQAIEGKIIDNLSTGTIRSFTPRQFYTSKFADGFKFC